MSSVSNQSNSDDREGGNKDNSSSQVSQGTAIHPTMQQQQAMSALVFEAVAGAAINSGGIRARTARKGAVAAVISSDVISTETLKKAPVAGEGGWVYYAGRLQNIMEDEDAREEWGSSSIMRKE